MPRAPAFVIRTFEPGDEAELVALANLVYGPYGGHVERTVELWRWSILARPGVTAADILVLERAREKGAPRGHGVLGPGGTVLELCLDPALTGEERGAAAAVLVAGLEERCRSRGLETISFELPRLDGRVRRHLLGEGYREEESLALQVILVDVPVALRRILQHRRGRLPHGWSPTFLIELAPGHYRSCPVRRIRVRPGDEFEVEADPASGREAEVDVTVGIDLSTLTDLILRRDTFEAARAAGRIAVEPAAAEQDARTLFDFLVLKSPWYSPPADGR
jgi:hypothetical protein